MIINIIDREFNLLGQIDEYESLITNKKYTGVGNFQLHLSSKNLYANTLVKDNIIFTDEGRAYIILYRKRNTSNGKLEVRGTDLKGYLKRYIVFPPVGMATYRINSNAETIMKQYVQTTLIRKNITNIEIAPNQNRGESIIYQSRYKNLSEELEKISLATGLGWEIRLDMERKKFIFDVVQGRNITIEQDLLPPAIFSVDYDNVQEQTLEESYMDYANTAIVAGQGEGADRAITIVGNTDGLDSVEIFVDAKDIENNAELPERGMQKLKEQEEILVFDSRVLTDKNLKYEIDYRLGDVATIQNEEWDITVNRRITEITEAYEASGFKLEVTFGENMPTILDKVKKIVDLPITENNVSVGEQGPPGETGLIGPKGDKGDVGPRGLQGIQGDIGDTGYAPVKGVDYFDGEKGDKGPQGLKGDKGDQGIQGIKGDTGAKGDVGPKGDTGVKGDTGKSGYTPIKNIDYFDGAKGDQGIQGIQGLKGDTGPQGDKGLKGDTGLTGAKGDKGDPFIYSDFTPTQLNGLKVKGDKGDTGPRGPQGEQGIQGVPGAAVADSVEWNKVLNKPNSYPPNAHNHTISQVANLQTALNGKEDRQYIAAYSKMADDGPLTYPKQRLSLTFGKAAEGWPFPYCGVITYSMLTNEAAMQIVVDYQNGKTPNGKIKLRMGTYNNATWGEWFDLATTDDIQKIITSPSEPSNLKTGDQWHKET